MDIDRAHTGHVPLEVEHHRVRRRMRTWFFLVAFLMGVGTGLGLALWR